MRVLRWGAWLLCAWLGTAHAAGQGGIDWMRDEHAAFERARAEQRFVLLYLEAVWCHWCHVMDHETYAAPAVGQAIAAHYVPLRIDQDARPDLAARYRDYGWPATIVFAADGSEIVKRQGYIAPAPMARLLAAIVEDPSPEHLAQTVEPAAAGSSSLSPDVRDELIARHLRDHDGSVGGQQGPQKFVDRDAVEYALVRAQAGDEEQRKRAMQTLDSALALVDPVWGGVYQYSTHSDWKRPHFEKLGARQGEYLRIYALAHAITGEPRYRDAVLALRRYIDGFLRSPDGGYFVSQDADLRPGEHSAEYFALDDAARRAQGVPRVDTHRYARETGIIAEALALWYEVSGDPTALDDAIAAVRWAQRERGLPEGGFRHDARDPAGPYLADNLAMGRALLQLYRATGDRAWLVEAGRAADTIERRLRAPAGYVSSPANGAAIAPIAQLDENVALARYANALSRYTGSAAHRGIAEHALRHLARRDVALSRRSDAGILLADDEYNRDPVHLTVIGGKQDPQAAALFQAALRLPAGYKRLDWWDREEGPLPNPDIKYPPLKRAAAFVCTEKRCSLPIVKPEEVAAFVNEPSAP